MAGMNADTGKRLDGIGHLAQSIRDILLTPIGSRVMRRDYGSILFELIDQPGNSAALLQVYAASIDAVLRWEPRVVPTRALIAEADLSRGQFSIELDVVAVDLDGVASGERLMVSVPLA